MTAERETPPWLKSSADGATFLLITVQAGAKRTELNGVHAGRLRVRVAAPPVDGAANAAIIRYFSALLSVRQRDIMIELGELSKRKTLRIVGLQTQQVVAELAAKIC